MSFFKGAVVTAATISNWVNSARTKKDIQKIYKEASEVNYVNRNVLALPYVNRLQLLLTTKDASDDDVYVYQSESASPGIDFIWGPEAGPENTIVSGGHPDQRARALVPFILKSQQDRLPVVVLHTGNYCLEDVVKENSLACEFISQSNLYYDGFRAMPIEDMVYLLFETMPDGTNPNAESLLTALLTILLHTEGKISFDNLAAFPLLKLMDILNNLKYDGEITSDEFEDIKREYAAGSSEIGAVRIFLNKLSRQAENVFGKPRDISGNVKKILNVNGIIAIDIGTSGNDIIFSYILNHLKHLQYAGKNFAMVLDGIAISKFPQICDMLHGRAFAVSHTDFVSSLYGGEKRGQDLFAEITGAVSANVLFAHKSGTSCQKWSEHLGRYHKIRIKMNITQASGFLTSANQRGISVDEADEPRVRAETISMLPDSMACIHNKNGTLFAEI